MMRLRQRRTRAWVLALGGPPLHIGAGQGVVAHADDGDGVQGMVELPVTAAIQPIAPGLPRAGGDRAGPGLGGEGGLRAPPASMGPAHQDLRGGDRADTGQLQQPGCDRDHEGVQVVLVLVDLGAQQLAAPGRSRGARGRHLVLQGSGWPLAEGRTVGDLGLGPAAAQLGP